MNKYLTLILMLIAIPSSSFAVAPFYESRFAADMDYMPMETVVAKITAIERDPENDANLILSHNGFIAKDEASHHAPSINQIPGVVIVRDKMQAIEPILKTNMSIELRMAYESLDETTDVTDQNSPLTFLSPDGDIVARTYNFDAEKKGLRIRSALPHTQSIITIKKKVDCMPDQPNVCHPRLKIESLVEGNVHEEILERGDSFGFDIPDVQNVYLTDAHTYKGNRNNEFSSYVRVELLVEFDDGVETEPQMQADALPDENFFQDRYCSVTFNDMGTNVIKHCGAKGMYYRLLNRIKDSARSAQPDPYIVC